MRINILLSILFSITLFVGCQDDDPSEDCINAGDMELPYYFAANIAGEEIRRENGTNGVLNRGVSSRGGGKLCFKSFKAGVLSHLAATGKGLTIDFDNLLTYEQYCDSIPKNDDFLTAFKVEEYDYLEGPRQESMKNTVIIYYKDHDDEVWISSKGPQSEGSSFVVLESSESELCEYPGQSKVDVMCKFTCTLYNFRTNEKLELVNGEAFYVFVEIPFN